MNAKNSRLYRAGLLLLSLLSLLPLLTACREEAVSESGTVFNFNTLAEESSTGLPTSPEIPLPTPSVSGGTALAMPQPQRQIPSYAGESENSENQEPAVPLSQPNENAIRGIAGHKVERFLKTLSTTPVYYHYILYPGEESEDIPSEILLALSSGESYMRIDHGERSQAVMQNSPSYYYFLDLNANTYEISQGNSSSNNELSMEAFRELEKNAKYLISTGRGEALFMGRQVHFEEFTMDGERYVRYYFVGDALVGHRSFEAGHIVETVQVLEVSNRYDENLFILPESLSQIQSGKLPRDEEEASEKKGP